MSKRHIRLVYERPVDSAPKIRKVVTEGTDLSVEQHRSLLLDQLKLDMTYDVKYPYHLSMTQTDHPEMQEWRREFIRTVGLAYDKYENIRMKQMRSEDKLTNDMDVDYLLCRE